MQKNSYSHRKSSSADILLTEFFNQLAKLPSHYVRRDSSKLYLDEKITSLSSLYDIYKNHCKEKDITTSCRKVFERKFHEMNLSLFRQKKTCVIYAANIRQVIKKTVPEENTFLIRIKQEKEKTMTKNVPKIMNLFY